MNDWNYLIILGFFFVITIEGQSIPCTTPNGETATCVSLGICPVLLEALTKDSVAKKFVEASACPGVFIVCCGKSGNFTQNVNKTQEIAKLFNETNREYVVRNKLLPSKKFCGMQHTDDYFYNGTETSVDEFPWLVYIGIPEDYVNNYYLRKESNCVGVLISNRFVLTSYKDCLLRAAGGSATKRSEIQSIIIGQHHIYKDVSCMPTPYQIDDCTRPIITVMGYSWYSSSLSKHNLAIITLLNKIEFSDYVRPICLPVNEDDMPKPGDTVFTSGWGENLLIEGKNVTLKKRIKHTVMGNAECQRGNRVQNPICGIPLKNNAHNVCPGDNGGPLMYQHSINWIVTGLVSGTKFCDEVRPIIANRITPEVIDIIYDEMVTIDKYLVLFSKEIPYRQYENVLP